MKYSLEQIELNGLHICAHAHTHIQPERGETEPGPITNVGPHPTLKAI
jgi:hypothetical protein